MRVLVALSVDASRQSCSEYLASLGCDVESSGDAEMAKRLATFRPYDGIVADLQFHHWQCTAGLPIVTMAKRRFPETIAIVLTTALNDRIMNAARSAGADWVLLKPQSLEAVAGFLVSRRLATMNR
jgi:CheY-like chemotaxis protein